MKNRRGLSGIGDGAHAHVVQDIRPAGYASSTSSLDLDEYVDLDDLSDCEVETVRRIGAPRGSNDVRIAVGSGHILRNETGDATEHKHNIVDLRII